MKKFKINVYNVPLSFASGLDQLNKNQLVKYGIGRNFSITIMSHYGTAEIALTLCHLKARRPNYGHYLLVHLVKQNDWLSYVADRLSIDLRNILIKIQWILFFFSLGNFLNCLLVRTRTA